jgi:hypothetical protein
MSDATDVVHSGLKPSCETFAEGATIAFVEDQVTCPDCLECWRKDGLPTFLRRTGETPRDFWGTDGTGVSDVDDLLAYIRRCLDDDERKIAAMEREEMRVQTAPIFQGHPPNWLAGVDIFVSSKRWRAEVEAKRQILDLYDEVRDEVRNPVSAEHRTNARARQFVLEQVIALHAQPFAGREGWQERWRLDAPRHVPANEDVTDEYERGDG